MAVTKMQIIDLLRTNDKAVCRALVVLNARQTRDEQIAEHTKHLNGRGFRPAHAKMGTSMADFFTRNGYLSPKQIAYWRRPMKTGQMRIEIYWKQLLEEAVAKEAKVQSPKALSNVPPATKEDDYREENEKWRRENGIKAPVARIPETDDFNRRWAEMKNEFGRREAQQEAFAFMNSPD